MSLENFKPKHKYLICVDSDGCAVDSMTVKHTKCFGPAFIETFDLAQYEAPCMTYWLNINLYSKTRGINRFLGLNKALHYVNDNFKKIDELEIFDKFINESHTYSNQALINYLETHNYNILKKCLEWSNLTNKLISSLKEEDVQLFKNVKEVLSECTTKADICVVSSANKEALEAEWTRLGLKSLISVLCSQTDGTKEKCIKELSKHYMIDNVLMIGDAMLDLQAASNNHVYFYPILVRYEELSWKNLKPYLDLFYVNEYRYCQNKLIDKFEHNFEI